jgi:hypothetical protein
MALVRGVYLTEVVAPRLRAPFRKIEAAYSQIEGLISKSFVNGSHEVLSQLSRTLESRTAVAEESDWESEPAAASRRSSAR